MHTAIIGNGIVGLSCAYQLAKKSSRADRITIIGKAPRPGSATLAAAAMLNSFAEVEADSLADEIDNYRFELSRAATRMWPSFLSDVLATGGGREDDGQVPLTLGTYIINNTAADDLDDLNFDAIVQALERFSEPHEAVSPSEIPNYLPEQPHRATRAIYIPGEGSINPRRFVAAMERALRAFGVVEFIDSEADTLAARNGVVSHAVLADGRTVEADKFLLSTGATAGDLLERSDLGISVQRIFYGVGVSVEISSPEFPHTKCVRTPNRGLACGVYSVPYSSDGSIIIGASNFVSPTPYFHGRLTSVEALLRAAMEQINRNFYRADFVRANVGWRPTSQDTYPMVGQSSIGNLVIATGTKRDGFHLAPLLSEKIASLLLGQEPDPRFAVFAPERKLIRTMDRETAIAKAVRHMMSAAYQHGFTPSKDRMPQRVMAAFKDDLEKVHDKAGAIDWGIPPEMIDMYRYGHAVG